MRRWLIHRCLDVHELFYAALPWLMLWIAGSEEKLNDVFMDRMGCGKIIVTDEERMWYAEPRDGDVR
jgi:hypothetical protein